MTKIQEINGLTILGDGTPKRGLTKSKQYPHGRKRLTYLVRCYCGNMFEAFQDNIKRGHTKSCGCKRPANYHGDYETPLYHRWESMHQRCISPKHASYRNYGGRGISVCDEWKSYRVFKEWAEKNGFSTDLELDRIDTDKDYSPDNCRWVTHSFNNRNKRNNRVIEYNGESKTITEWSEIFNQPRGRIKGRLNLGWTIHDAFTKDKIDTRKKAS